MPLALGLVLVAYNNAANLWHRFQGALYVPLNVAAAGGVYAWARWGMGLGDRDLGLRAGRWWLGLAIGVAAAAPAFVALAHPRTARFVADARLAGLSPSRAAYVVLVRIPVGTALVEELAFRGALYGAWRPRGPGAAAVASSVAFGLWHVTPTLSMVRANRPSARGRGTVAIVLGGIAFTTAAGFFLAWLRVRAGGIGAPFALHASVNALAATAALLAHRRRPPGATEATPEPLRARHRRARGPVAARTGRTRTARRRSPGGIEDRSTHLAMTLAMNDHPRSMRARRGGRLMLLALLATPVSVPPAASAAPEGPRIDAAAWIVVDHETGETVFERNADALVPPASLTKLLTALVVRDHTALDRRLTISAAAANAWADHLHWPAGRTFTVEDVLHGMLLESSNGAAIALAEHVSGSELTFVHLMNDKARFLGATHSWWLTSHGLDVPGQLVTARDLAVVMRAVLADPVLTRILGTTRYSAGPMTFRSRERLLTSYRGAIAAKNGLTRDAGYCVAAAAERDGRVLVSIVMRSPSAGANTATLLDAAFERAQPVPKRGGISLPLWARTHPQVQALPSQRPDRGLVAAPAPQAGGRALGAVVAGLAVLSAAGILRRRRAGR